MSLPWNEHTDQKKHFDCFDLSPERLKSMSPSELEEAMEETLSVMVDENYDPAVIDAYLDALDQKAPIPEFPDSEASYADFQRRLQSISTNDKETIQPTRRNVRPSRILRGGLVAILAVSCLLGSMVAVQASGVDVFGAMARWTDSVFSFGTIQNQGIETQSAADRPNAEGQSIISGGITVPEEYQDIQVALAERGAVLYYPKMPEGYTVQDSLLYIDPMTDNTEFSIGYQSGTSHFALEIVQTDGTSTMEYQKDDDAVEQYVYNDITHYIFSNNANTAAAWIVDGIEYSMTTNMEPSDVKELIKSMYEE